LSVVAAVTLALALQQLTPTLDGPPAPVAPEVIARDGGGRVTVRAIKLTAPLSIDGKLDDEVYQREQPFGDLLQVVPDHGAVGSERSDVWVLYDADNMYVACRCWDSSPPSQWIANELRRDTSQLRQNDNFGVMFDTFYDRRSGFAFYTNPLGARADYSVVDEGAPNSDWNPVWEVKTGQFDGGWIVEMAIPFKSLRYRSGANQVWGFQARRSIRRKNEWDYLTALPQNLGGPLGLNRISSAGSLVALDLPPVGKNIELKPYAISSLTTDRVKNPPVRNDPSADWGGDVKYGVTASLTADFTYNTDFAQVEIDEQQVNLTRFSLFFPEKRDFFLEGRGLFDFARGGIAGSAPTSGPTTIIQPYLFYSRRIGLNRNRVIPIQAGGRLTGKAGKYGIGLLNIEARDEAVSATPRTNFTVLRLKRDVLRRSYVGAMFTNRSAAVAAPGANTGYGVDAAFSFFENVGFSGYYARTATETLARNADSYQALADYGGDRYGAHLEYLKVGDHFNPEIGFVSRANFGRTYGTLRFSPRPHKVRRVRKYTWQVTFDNFDSGAGTLETRIASGQFIVDFENSDQVSVSGTREYELLVRPTPVAGVTFPAGGYQFSNALLTYGLGSQRRVSGQLSLQVGEFYDGTITSVAYSSGGLFPSRIAVLKQFSVEPSVQINRVDAASGAFTTKVLRARTDYGFSPLMFASALLQYSSGDRAFSSNLRFRWEYRPGSELFVVYTDERDTSSLAQQAPVRGLKNRAFVVKINRLLRY
jgi:hypothetical protein